MAVSAFIGRYGHEAKELAEYIAREDDSYIIAIARKCPRLFETLIRESHFFPVSVLDRVITEHALPFHFASQTIWNKYHLCDDSILYGSTYRKVERLLLTYARLSNQQMPDASASINIKKSTLFRLTGVTSLNLDDVVSFRNGDELEATTFINYEMSSFLKGAPYDLEFPVIYCTGDFNSDSLDERLKEIFPDENSLFSQEEPILLEGEEPIVRKSWTILFRAVNERNINSTDPEFSKIRLFLNEAKNELKIVPFCPYPIPDDILNRLASFFPVKYQALFAEAYERVKNYLSYTPQNGDEEYMVYQTQRSLVIWGNYLLSINMFLRVWKEHESLFQDLGIKEWHIEKKDLQYLLGSDLAQLFLSLLEDWIESKELMHPLIIDYSPIYFNQFEEIQVPVPYIQTFKSEMVKAYTLADSVNDVISSHFYCQHKYIDEISRRKEVDKYTRLRFGITYRGLYNHILIYNNVPHFELEMHKVVDAQIDEGSIVPKYIKLTGGEKPVWVRMFRSGERISKSIEMKSLIFHLLQQIKEKLAAALIPKTVLEVFLLQTLKNTIRKTDLNCVGDYPFALEKAKVDGLPLYCVALPMDGNKKMCVTEWLETKGIVRSSISSYEIIEDFHSQIYPYKTILDDVYKNMSDAFARLIDTYYNVKNYIFKISLAGLDPVRVKFIQIQVLNLWKDSFKTWLAKENVSKKEDILKKEADLALSYQYIDTYYTYYRDENNRLFKEMDVLKDDNSYWVYLKRGKREKEEMSLWVFDEDIDNKFQIASLICAIYSLLELKFSTIKPSEKVSENPDARIKLLWESYKDKLIDKNKTKLKMMCDEIFDEYF